MDGKFEAAVQGQLAVNEKILWQGQPDARANTKKLASVRTFGIVFTIVIAIVGYLASPSPASGITDATKGCIILAGLGIAVAFMPFVAYKEWTQAVYVITDRRIFMFNVGTPGVRSYSKIDPSHLRRVEQPDGSGDLVFAREREVDPKGGAITVDIGFYGIPHVAEVEKLIRQGSARFYEQLVHKTHARLLAMKGSRDE